MYSLCHLLPKIPTFVSGIEKKSAEMCTTFSGYKRIWIQYNVVMQPYVE